MLSVSTLLLVAQALSADSVTLTLDIQKGGDLRWKDVPCQADVIAKDGSVTHVDNAAEILVFPGSVDVVVACAAHEGTVKKSARINAVKDQTVKVTFAPGFVSAAIEREGHLSAGDVIVYDAFDHEVARAKDRTVLPVDAGPIRVAAVVDKATAGASRDARGEQRTTIKTGQKTELKIDASDGELLVNVFENGRPAQALVALREPGNTNRIVEIIPGSATSVPAGTWDLVSQLEDAHDFREQLTRGVVVSGKKRTNANISHATGKLQVVTSADVVVDLLLPGALQPFNQLEPNSEARLAPGKYVVRATRDAILDDGTKPLALSSVNVSAGAMSRLVLNPAVAHVDVEVRVGGAPRPLAVGLTLAGAAAPVVSREADVAGKVGFDVGPQAVTVSTSLPTAHGPLEVKKQLTLKAGNNQVRLDIDVGTFVAQVIDGGAAVTAEVALFARPTRKGQPEAPRPLVVVKAGEEALLPPGTYVLAVTMKGEQRLFGEVKVTSGQRVERAVDWSTQPPK